MSSHTHPTTWAGTLLIDSGCHRSSFYRCAWKYPIDTSASYVSHRTVQVEIETHRTSLATRRWRRCYPYLFTFEINSRRIFVSPSAVLRIGGTVQIRTKAVSRPTGAQTANCAKGAEFPMKRFASQVTPQTTIQSGTYRKIPLHKSAVLTGPSRPAK